MKQKTSKSISKFFAMLLVILTLIVSLHSESNAKTKKIEFLLGGDIGLSSISSCSTSRYIVFAGLPYIKKTSKIYNKFIVFDKKTHKLNSFKVGTNTGGNYTVKGKYIYYKKAKYINRISINGKNNKKIVKIGKNNQFCGLNNNRLYYCKNNTYYSCKLNGLDLKKENIKFNNVRETSTLSSNKAKILGLGVGTIIKVKTKKNGKTKTLASNGYYTYIMSGDWVLYESTTMNDNGTEIGDGNYGVFVVRYDGKYRTKILENDYYN